MKMGFFILRFKITNWNVVFARLFVTFNPFVPNAPFLYPHFTHWEQMG